MPEPDQGLDRQGEAAAAQGQAPAGPPPSFASALAFWFKLGWISFGGPAGQIALMHQEIVERRRWIDEQRFLHALNFCMLLPGPEAQQLATYIGWMLHRTWGGVVAGLLFVLPSLFILILLSWLYVSHGDAPLVAALLWGVKPAVVAVVVAAVQRIGRRVLQHRLLWAISAAAFVALAVFDLPFPLVIGAAAALGWWGRVRWAPVLAAGAGGKAPVTAPMTVPAMPGADTPRALPPAPALDRPQAAADASRRSAGRAAGVCLALGLLAYAGLVAAFGVDGTLTTMAAFFTQAALLTFGGAYAVLPFVVQGAVEQHQWLSAAQMIDGLALGETTPGPLIMVVAFVGFLGGWGQTPFGADQPLLAGIAGACVATGFTFLPSFLFILGGAPLVERSRGVAALAAPLTAISAAVVGVILNLAVYLAVQVLWPGGAAPHGGGIDWAAVRFGQTDFGALIIGLGAGALLWRGRLGVVPVIALAGVAGLVLRGVIGA